MPIKNAECVTAQGPCAASDPTVACEYLAGYCNTVGLGNGGGILKAIQNASDEPLDPDLTVIMPGVTIRQPGKFAADGLEPGDVITHIHGRWAVEVWRAWAQLGMPKVILRVLKPDQTWWDIIPGEKPKRIT
jgi:hypothetical protein